MLTTGSQPRPGRLSSMAKKTSGGASASLKPSAPCEYIQIEVPPMMP